MLIIIIFKVRKLIVRTNHKGALGKSFRMLDKV